MNPLYVLYGLGVVGFLGFCFWLGYWSGRGIRYQQAPRCKAILRSLLPEQREQIAKTKQLLEKIKKQANFTVIDDPVIPTEEIRKKVEELGESGELKKVMIQDRVVSFGDIGGHTECSVLCVRSVWEKRPQR